MKYHDAINIEDLRCIARRRLPRFVFTYVDSGSEDEVTLHGNREAFACLRFRPRTLVDVSRRDLSTTLLGARSELPVIVGPTALNGLSWRDGDIALARAASAAGVPFAMSTVSMNLMEDIAREALRNSWLDLKPDLKAAQVLAALNAKLGWTSKDVSADLPKAMEMRYVTDMEAKRKKR